MTHNFHWNVTGPQFNSLHLMFMAQYTEQWNALDIIAERIRAHATCQPRWVRYRTDVAGPRIHACGLSQEDMYGRFPIP